MVFGGVSDDDEEFQQPRGTNDIFQHINFDEEQGGECDVQSPQNATTAEAAAERPRTSRQPSYKTDSRRIDLRRQEPPTTPSSHVKPVLSREEDIEPENEILSEPEETVEPAKRKLRKKKGHFQTMSADELLNKVSALLTRMETAAASDNDSNRCRLPAIEKLKMLEEVEEACIHREMQPILLNEGLLGVLKSWIEPLTDGTLPNIKIRTTVLRILQKLPIDTADLGDRQNLKTSQIGSRVKFLSKIKDETRENRRMAWELVQRWSRPIFEEARRYDEEERIQEQLTARKRRMEAERKEEEKRKTLKPGDPDFRYVASRPQPTRDYVIKPKDRVDVNVITGQKRNPVMQQLNRFKRTQKH